jgi:hypothetical protein
VAGLPEAPSPPVAAGVPPDLAPPWSWPPAMPPMAVPPAAGPVAGELEGISTVEGLTAELGLLEPGPEAAPLEDAGAAGSDFLPQACKARSAAARPAQTSNGFMAIPYDGDIATVPVRDTVGFTQWPLQATWR